MIAISQAVCVLGVLGLAAVGLKIARPARRGVARPAVVELTGIQVPIDSIQIVVIHCSRDDCQNSELRPLGNLAEDFEKSGWRLFDGKWRCPCCNGLRSAAT